jgi:predicted nucleotidyltransferase
MPIRQWDDIADLCQRIVAEFEPERIVLFDSYAYGTPKPPSDVDLLVLMPYHGSAGQPSVDILQRIKPSCGVDILVRTPAQVTERLAMDDYFMQEIISKGRVLYEDNHARVG